MRVSLHQLLKAMLDHGGSDMHITSGSPPTFRIHGRISKIKSKALTPAQTRELCYSVLTDYQKAMFEETKELDLSFTIKDVGRFRGNIFFQRGSVSAAFRHIPFDAPAWDTLGLPNSVPKMVNRPKGLVLVTGGAGSGKTTTLAALISLLNETKHQHIVTIEDPIEFVFKHKKCLINQREVGIDTKSFASALRAALREDPDVVMVGEMRDRETIETALLLAETGQLVMSTLHTNSAAQTINRILNVFPAEEQPQIRMQLSMVIEGIVTQALLRRTDKRGRILVSEVMIPNTSIRSLIRENKVHQIESAMLMGQEVSGMVTFNQSLLRLVETGVITEETAISASAEPEELIKKLVELEKKAS